MTTAIEELVHLDPATLVIGANVRTDVHPDAPEFAASIKARGVLEVITAYRDTDGDVVVLRGQRRTVVSAEVGTPTGTVPVPIVPVP
jgi:ParB family chromosome partitioning protein